MTPDALEFAIIFPKIVNEHIKRCSGKSGFLYVTSLKGRYYDLPDSFENITKCKIPKLTPVEMSKSDLQILKNYKLKFLDGLRQNTIRNQNTKFKAGTLPLRAYASDSYPDSPIDVNSILSPRPANDVPTRVEIPVLYGPGSVLVLQDISSQLVDEPDPSEQLESRGRMADVFIGIVKEPILVNDKEAKITLFTNDSDSPLRLTSCGDINMQVNYIQKDILLQTNPKESLCLSESDYELCRVNNLSRLLEQEDDLVLDDEELQYLAHNLGNHEETTRSSYGRTRKPPSWMVNYV